MFKTSIDALNFILSLAYNCPATAEQHEKCKAAVAKISPLFIPAQSPAIPASDGSVVPVKKSRK